MSCSACFVSTQTDTDCVPRDCGGAPILKVAEIDVIANSPQKWGC